MIEWGLRNSISWEELVKRLEATIESYSLGDSKNLQGFIDMRRVNLPYVSY
jgi:hypothetical protein